MNPTPEQIRELALKFQSATKMTTMYECEFMAEIAYEAIAPGFCKAREGAES